MYHCGICYMSRTLEGVLQWDNFKGRIKWEILSGRFKLAKQIGRWRRVVDNIFITLLTIFNQLQLFYY